MHRLLLALLLLLLPLVALGASRQQTPLIQSGDWRHSTADDWLPGICSSILIEADRLRLGDGQSYGEYISAPLQAPFAFNAGVVQWMASVDESQDLAVDVRSSVDGQIWGVWRAVQPMQQAEQSISHVLVFEPGANWLQYRIRLAANSGSPILDEIRLIYIDSTTGPSLADLGERVPLSGPPALTPRPQVIVRAEWSGANSLPRVTYQRPQRVELVQLQASVDEANPPATLRALRWVVQNILRQPDLPYHYVIDGRGDLYEAYGRVTGRLPDAEAGTVRIALVVDSGSVSEAMQAQVISLLSWLVASYGIELQDIAATPDGPQQLLDLVAELQPAIDRSIVRSRRFFTRNTTTSATDRLALFNPSASAAYTTVRVFRPGAEQRYPLEVPPGQRVDFTLNTLFPDTTTLGVAVEANQPLYAERILAGERTRLGSVGAADPARTWYFSEGTTASGTDTSLLVFNPNPQEVSATLLFYPDGTEPLTQTVRFEANTNTTLHLRDLLPGAQFGLKLVASEPVVAERAVVLEMGAAHLAPGVDQLSRRWSFAEGSTTDGITTTLHLLNPWPQRVAISLQVMSDDGTSLSRRYALPAQSRLVLALNDLIPALPFATELIAERPIAAERIMRFDGGTAATASPGASAPATRWTFVEGSTMSPTEQLLLVGNPNPAPVTLDFAYILADGTVKHHTYTAPPISRFTVVANIDVPGQPVVTTVITASRPIVAERTIVVTGPHGRAVETSAGLPGR
jgi:hypothetical protein